MSQGFALTSERIDLRKILGNAVNVGSGAAGTGTLRMILSADDPAVTSLAILDDWDESDRAKVNLVVGQAGITAGAGAVAANTPRVTHASDDPVTTALQIIDDWDESDRAKVNPIVGQAGVAGGTGVDGATVQRVSLATNVPLPAGTNAIGKLSANSGVDIGDVDVTSIIPGTGATNLGKAEDAAHTTGDVGVMALAVRQDAASAFTNASADYSPLRIDNINSLCVSDRGAAGLPTFYFNFASTFELPSMFIIDPNTLVIPTASNAALQVTGDEAHDAVDDGNPHKIGGKATTDTSLPSAVANADRVNAFFGLNGHLHTRDEPQRSSITQVMNAVVWNATTTRNSTSFDCTRFRTVMVYWSLTESGAATDIRFYPEYTPDAGTTWCKLYKDAWTDMRFTVAEMPLQECWPIENTNGLTLRITGVSTGTDGSNTITGTVWIEGVS